MTSFVIFKPRKIFPASSPEIIRVFDDPSLLSFITNFIGVYDNYITKQECNKAIKLYEDQDKFNNTINRD